MGGRASTHDELVQPDSLRIHFRFAINSEEIDPDLGANRSSLDSLSRLFDTRGPFVVTISGTASPDGRLDKNLALAKRRAHSLDRYIKEFCGRRADFSIIHNASVPWDRFRDLIAYDRRLVEIASAGSDTVNSDVASRMKSMRTLDGGHAWETLATDIFPQLRGASVMLLAPSNISESEPSVISETQTTEASLPEITTHSAPEPQTEPETSPEYTPESGNQWALASNLLADAMAMPNLAGEITAANHWSVALSLYYSAWNYGSSVRKFRTFILRPEARYWLRRALQGFYLNAHVQMASYNFAMPSWHYRIQDADGKHPALGGGIGAGYRLPLGTSSWSLDASLGLGVYHLKYDRFENRYNGMLVDTRSRTWVGIDNISIGLVYNFKTSRR